jgi:hypothetical protein
MHLSCIQNEYRIRYCLSHQGPRLGLSNHNWVKKLPNGRKIHRFKTELAIRTWSIRTMWYRKVAAVETRDEEIQFWYFRNTVNILNWQCGNKPSSDNQVTR